MSVSTPVSTPVKVWGSRLFEEIERLEDCGESTPWVKGRIRRGLSQFRGDRLMNDLLRTECYLPDGQSYYLPEERDDGEQCLIDGLILFGGTTAIAYVLMALYAVIFA